jgi:hypothetical protein
MTHSSHCPTVNVHRLPEYWPHLDVLLLPEGDPEFLACCVPSESLTQFDFNKFPHHPLQVNTPLILNDPTSRNPVDLSQVSVEASPLPHIYLITDQETFDSGICR